MSLTSEIYEWFMTGKKPTQAQFWASWGSFWNKLEQIPQSAIAGLTAVLNAKAEKAQFDAHKTDTAAHAALFDAKEDKTQKGVAGGYVPLDEFVKIANEYLTIVNDLVTGGAMSLASAETVKTLKTQIDGINTILTSNDVNLDTVQEVVDAIKTVQTSLSTILVNDLTTGGTTKALTAEMGKTLKGLIDGLTTNKVDKVAGERLINATEITKLAAVTNVTTTVKSILSTALATQNVAGFVTYLNALTPVLVVGANETVTYKTTDTGRVFELLLRGRSFGVGQAAIVAADVIEVTEFLNKDIKLSNYLNTRDDGGNPTNKVLSTDVNGNLKMYSMTGFPAPYLATVIPDSNLPLTNFNILLKGDFFTPNMTIAFAGQTVVSKTFISSKEYRISLTTGSAEGMFSITLNNGVSITYPNAFLVVLGTPYTPVVADFINVSSGVTVNDGELIANVTNTMLAADLNIAWDMTKKFRVYFSISQSPLIAYASQYYAMATLSNTINSNKLRFHFLDYTPQGYISYSYNNTDPTSAAYDIQNSGTYNRNYFIDWDLTNMRLFANNVFQWNFPANDLGTGMVLKFNLRNHDIKKIKYIELPM